MGSWYVCLESCSTNLDLNKFQKNGFVDGQDQTVLCFLLKIEHHARFRLHNKSLIMVRAEQCRGIIWLGMKIGAVHS